MFFFPFSWDYEELIFFREVGQPPTRLGTKLDLLSPPVRPQVQGLDPLHHGTLRRLRGPRAREGEDGFFVFGQKG